jgi:hypothetical protein
MRNLFYGSTTDHQEDMGGGILCICWITVPKNYFT